MRTDIYSNETCPDCNKEWSEREHLPPSPCPDCGRCENCCICEEDE